MADDSTPHYLCMYCRTLLDDAARHTELGHDVVPFDQHGRSALVLAAQAPAGSRLIAARRRPNPVNPVGVVLTAAGIVAVSVFGSMMYGSPGAVFWGVGMAALWLGMSAVAFFRHKPELGWIRAALPPQPSARRFTGILEGENRPDPLTGTPCLAYAVELHKSGARPSSLLCRDERCNGATLTSDGSLVRLPAGRAEVHGTSQTLDLLSVDVLSFMRRIGLVTDAGQLLFDVDEVRITHLFAGDHIILEGTVEVEASPQADATGYREIAHSQLAVTGTPTLRKTTTQELTRT